jgi:hypothetical protein
MGWSQYQAFRTCTSTSSITGMCMCAKNKIRTELLALHELHGA